LFCFVCSVVLFCLDATCFAGISRDPASVDHC
jgi:hypothetical protein